MKISKLVVALSLSVGVMSSAFAVQPYGTLSKKGQDAMSFFSLCSITYAKFSAKMTKNPELRDSTMSTARDLYKITLMTVGESDADALLDISDEALTKMMRESDNSDKVLANTMAGCLTIIQNLKK